MTLLLVFTVSLAQNRRGGSVEATLELQGASRPALIEIRTQPELTKNHEMHVFFYRTDDDNYSFEVQRTVTPVAPGLYRLEHTFPTRGVWGMTARYGLGLDVYQADVASGISPTYEGTLRFRDMFYGSLGVNVPSYVQPLGFGIFGLMLVIALTLIVTILRWLKRQNRTVMT